MGLGRRGGASVPAGSGALALLLAGLAAGCATSGTEGPDVTGCEPADCLRRCVERGYREAHCASGGLCQCSGAMDADAGVEDGAGDGGDVEVEPDVGDETEEFVEAGCEGFDAAGVPGAYGGTFLGMLSGAGMDGAMEGSVLFDVEESGTGGWSFEGVMRGTAMSGVYPWSARVQGSVTCTELTGNFYDGLVTVEGTDYHFTGTMESGFTPYSFPDGTFSGACTDCPVAVTGSGTWNADHV